MHRAVTFDFWDTIVRDNSDEPKRTAKGLGSKMETRYKLFAEELQRYHPSLSHEQTQTAFDHANAWFRQCWKGEHHTPKVSQRLLEGFRFLGLEATPTFDNLVTQWERMEVEISPDLAPGIESALEELVARGYQLGIISDTIVTPGWGLQQMLQEYGLLHLFRVFIFSDEWGAAKPSPTVFQEATRRFNLSYSSLVHVGDREPNDVAGPLAVNAKAILYTGVIDRGHNMSQAHAVCHDHLQLPDLVDSLFAP